VQGLAFTPDEKSLVSIGTDGRARLHSIVPEKIVPELCAKAGALTRDEWTRYVGQDIPYRDTCP
jgi:hypothetical protein